MSYLPVAKVTLSSRLALRTFLLLTVLFAVLPENLAVVDLNTFSKYRMITVTLAPVQTTTVRHIMHKVI